MQFSKNTSGSSKRGLLIKVFLILIIIIGAITLLGKIEFPSPNKDIEKIIPNEKLKIVK
jgi:hypothetical protein